MHWIVIVVPNGVGGVTIPGNLNEPGGGVFGGAGIVVGNGAKTSPGFGVPRRPKPSTMTPSQEADSAKT